MGAKSDWLDKQADAVAEEIEGAEEELRALKKQLRSLEDQVEAAKALSPAEDDAWAETHAARADRRQLSLLRSHPQGSAP